MTRTAEEIRTTFRKNSIISVACLLCRVAGIEPIDSNDGSSNWWIFNAEAEKIVDDVMKRYAIPDQVLLQWEEMRVEKGDK
ncbi:MAG TPA: hypothetical protein VEP90_20430 [Methylomirabilota bacterium]|nr:hypothetical protein [Methylomirabilota bacterium]